MTLGIRLGEITDAINRQSEQLKELTEKLERVLKALEAAQPKQGAKK